MLPGGFCIATDHRVKLTGHEYNKVCNVISLCPGWFVLTVAYVLPYVCVLQTYIHACVYVNVCKYVSIPVFSLFIHIIYPHVSI